MNIINMMFLFFSTTKDVQTSREKLVKLETSVVNVLKILGNN